MTTKMPTTKDNQSSTSSQSTSSDSSSISISVQQAEIFGAQPYSRPILPSHETGDNQDIDFNLLDEEFSFIIPCSRKHRKISIKSSGELPTQVLNPNMKITHVAVGLTTCTVSESTASEIGGDIHAAIPEQALNDKESSWTCCGDASIELIQPITQFTRDKLDTGAIEQGHVCNVYDYEQSIRTELAKTAFVEELKQAYLIESNHEIPVYLNIDDSLPSRFRHLGKRKMSLPIKVVTGAPSEAPHNLSDASAANWEVIRALGKGTFGHALLIAYHSSQVTQRLPQPKDNSTLSINCTGNDRGSNTAAVIKVDLNSCFVLWECIIHKRIRQRLTSVERSISADQQLHDRECFPNGSKYVISPTSLHIYANAALISMPLGELGTLHNFISQLQRGQLCLSVKDHEVLCALLAFQMLKAIEWVHEADVIHCDIKPDNWVLTRGNDHNHGQARPIIQLKLIDFGQSKDLRQLPNEKQEQLDQLIKFRGMNAAAKYACPQMTTGEPWCYEADHYAVCACIHTVLYYNEMTTCHESAQVAEKRGFTFTDMEQFQHDGLYRVPKCTLKRYWCRSLWSEIIIPLLNSDRLNLGNNGHRQIPYSKLLSSLHRFLHDKQDRIEPITTNCIQILRKSFN